MNDMFLPVSSAQSTPDYTQSANTLFHFMRRGTFLESALKRKALVPRYCFEDIHYLDIKHQDEKFGEIAILQKCFCDIPLHKLVLPINLSLTEDSEELLRAENINRRKLVDGNSHPGFYGEYALAFEKNWCEQNDLQPIHYLNPHSAYTRDFSSLISSAINSESIPDEVVSDVLQRLALVKPLRGKMKRQVTIDEKGVIPEFYKNFHDEQEWRYIPDLKKLTKHNDVSKYKIKFLIANPQQLKQMMSPGIRYIDIQSDVLTDISYDFLWLKFEYSNVKYIIVPDNQARIDLIDDIMALPSSNFDDRASETQEKYILISKILMLEEIRKDW